jgi:hypothetical protein
MDNAVAEPGKRCDGLAADDGEERNREADAHADKNDRQGSR